MNTYISAEMRFRSTDGIYALPCSAKREALGLKTSDELQFWFMNRIKDYCTNMENRPLVWVGTLKMIPCLIQIWDL